MFQLKAEGSVAPLGIVHYILPVADDVVGVVLLVRQVGIGRGRVQVSFAASDRAIRPYSVRFNVIRICQ